MKRFLKGVALFAILGLAPALSSAQNNNDHNFEIAKNLEVFHEIVSELDRFYVDTINPKQTIEKGIQAMLSSIDPYTEYFPENDMPRMKMKPSSSCEARSPVWSQPSGSIVSAVASGLFR